MRQPSASAFPPLPSGLQSEASMTTYPTCINCGTEITDPTSPNEETEYIHLITLSIRCHSDDLKRQGLNVNDGYVACPTPQSEDYDIPAGPKHAQAIRDGLADCVSCETGSPSPCPTCGRTDPS